MTLLKNLFRPKRQDPRSMNLDTWLDVLRTKWSQVPAAQKRSSTFDLLAQSDKELVEFWEKNLDSATTQSFADRGWYHELYKDSMRNKRVLDIGSGLGFDGLTFARNGAQVNFLDVVESNLNVLQRLASAFGLEDTDFHHFQNLAGLEDFLASRKAPFDIFWSQGSLHHTPFEIMRQEVAVLLQKLKVGGRWIGLAYPKARWERDGAPSFEKWGDHTDGGAPWTEWYDLDKLLSLFAPANFEVVLYFEFHDNDFVWFDFKRTS